MRGASRLSVAFISAMSPRMWATSLSSMATRASSPGSRGGPPVSAMAACPQRVGVVERAVAVAVAGGRGDRAPHIVARLLDGKLDRHALGQPGGNRRRQRAAGAVGMAAGDTRAAPLSPPG